MQRSALVIGATGQVGKKLCFDLVQSGWKVTALSRNVDKPPKISQSITWKSYDLFNRQSFRPYIKESEVVFCTVGSAQKKNVSVYSKGYQQIITCMQEQGKSRLVGMTAAHHHPDSGFFVRNILNFMLGQIFEDMERFENKYKNYQGSVHITILRPFRIMDIDAKKRGLFKAEKSWTKDSTKWQFQSDIAQMTKFMIQQATKQFKSSRPQFFDVGTREK